MAGKFEMIAWIYIAVFGVAGLIFLLYLIVQCTSSSPPGICSHAVIWSVIVILCVGGGLLVYADKARESTPLVVQKAVDYINSLDSSAPVAKAAKVAHLRQA